MKLITKVLGAAIVAAPMVFSSAAMADGKALFSAKGCAGCHGADAKGGMGGMAPRLAGMQSAYLLEQFKLIRDGKRASGKAPMMKGAVSAVSDDDATAITAYLGGL